MSFTLIDRAEAHHERIAVVAPEGVFTYDDLLGTSATVATRLLTGRDDMEGERVCFLVPPGWDHVAVQWGIWRAGGFAVPMAVSHPALAVSNEMYRFLGTPADSARGAGSVSHSSGMQLPSSSLLVPLAMSQLSGSPLSLQSAKVPQESSIPFSSQSPEHSA